MTRLLEGLEACFEGVIPSLIATVARDGTPNVSYLSHVVRVDEADVAVSNQFFSKTATNVRETGRATLLLVDAEDGGQHRLTLAFVESRERGPLFEEVDAQLRASSAQLGLQHVMKLRAVDVFRVLTRESLPLPAEAAAVAPGEGDRPPPLLAATALAGELAGQREVEPLVDLFLHGLRERFGYERAMLLVPDSARRRLVVLASAGYEGSGTGAEIAVGEGLAGMAAAEGRRLKSNDLSRTQRLAGAAAHDSGTTAPGEEIPLPRLPDALSQLALPLVARGTVHGVLFIESPRRRAFPVDAESALDLVARQFTALLLLLEHEGLEPPAPPPAPTQPVTSGAALRVVHHAYDDSVFIDGEYVIKGVPGRLLVHLLAKWRDTGRSAFTNRELRLDEALRLPEIKDNLETRLLLLRRRLDERGLPLRLAPTGRGRFELKVGRPVELQAAAAGPGGRRPA